MMPVRRARSAWRTRAAADWTRAWARLTSAGDHVLGPAEVDDGPRLLAALGLDPRQVADAQAFELPDGWTLTSSRPRPLVEAAVGPDAEDPGLDDSPGVWKPLSRTVGRSGRVFSRRIRRLGRLDERPPRGQLGAVGQGDAASGRRAAGPGRSA